MPHARAPPLPAARPGQGRGRGETGRWRASERVDGRMVHERFCHSSFYQYGSYSSDWNWVGLITRVFPEAFSFSFSFLTPDFPALPLKFSSIRELLIWLKLSWLDYGSFSWSLLLLLLLPDFWFFGSATQVFINTGVTHLIETELAWLWEFLLKPSLSPSWLLAFRLLHDASLSRRHKIKFLRSVISL
jgi:hypothetical protein